MTVVDPGGVRAASGTDGFALRMTMRQGNVWVTLFGDLDVATGARVESSISAIAGVPGISRIDIDASGVEFADAAGVGALVRARETAHRIGVVWFLGPVSGRLRRGLDLAGVGPMHDLATN